MQALNEQYPVAAQTAIHTVQDLALHRKQGKALGERGISGNLTGLFRLKFDVDGQRPERFRVVYRLEPVADPDTVVVVVVGIRDDHEVYRLAVQRL